MSKNQIKGTENLKTMIQFAARNLELANSYERESLSRAISKINTCDRIHTTELLSAYSVIIKKLRSVLVRELQKSYFGFNVPSLNSLFRKNKDRHFG